MQNTTHLLPADDDRDYDPDNPDGDVFDSILKWTVYIFFAAAATAAACLLAGAAAVKLGVL